MQTLLTLTIIVEPDRQRLARFAMDAVEALGGNVFAAANRLEGLLRRVREDCARVRPSRPVCCWTICPCASPGRTSANR